LASGLWRSRVHMRAIHCRVFPSPISSAMMQPYESAIRLPVTQSHRNFTPWQNTTKSGYYKQTYTQIQLSVLWALVKTSALYREKGAIWDTEKYQDLQRDCTSLWWGLRTFPRTGSTTTCTGSLSLHTERHINNLLLQHVILCKVITKSLIFITIWDSSWAIDFTSPCFS
jgi:hypothetical protein